MQVDVLVAGQGLAGTAVVVAAWRAGLSVAVAEPARWPGATASRVAAGLVTPLTGKKINPGWRLDTLLPLAREFYADASQRLGRTFFHSIPVHRWFVDAAEAGSFAARMEEERIRGWVAGMLAPDARVRAPDGGFAMQGGGWLDVPLWLDSVRERLQAEGRWIDAAVNEREVCSGSDGIRWRGVDAGHLILCNGLAARDSWYFPGLPFRPAAGEVLALRMQGGVPGEVWNRGGKWLAPRPDGSCLLGATYGFGEWIARPSPGGRRELLDVLRQWLVGPAAELLDHRAGVRPILHQSRPVAGYAQSSSRVAMLNGLGSKGVLVAPWAATQLIDSLRRGTGLEAELDVARLVCHVKSQHV